MPDQKPTLEYGRQRRWRFPWPRGPLAIGLSIVIGLSVAGMSVLCFTNLGVEGAAGSLVEFVFTERLVYLLPLASMFGVLVGFSEYRRKERQWAVIATVISALAFLSSIAICALFVFLSAMSHVGST
jgi:hypothetical protein